MVANGNWNDPVLTLFHCPSAFSLPPDISFQGPGFSFRFLFRGLFLPPLCPSLIAKILPSFFSFGQVFLCSNPFILSASDLPLPLRVLFFPPSCSHNYQSILSTVSSWRRGPIRGKNQNRHSIINEVLLITTTYWLIAMGQGCADCLLRLFIHS